MNQLLCLPQVMAEGVSGMTGLFAVLPPQLVDSIVQSLPTKQIVVLSLTCKTFHAICQQEALWKQKWLAGYHKEASFQACFFKSCLEYS